MKGLRKVVWAEGVFLGQQHFQAWDRYQFHTQNLRARWQQPYGWGVGQLVWDEAALLNGRLDLVVCQALLPDGRVVDYRRETDGPVFIDLTRHEQDSLTICLMIPRNDLADTITGYETGSRLTGWTSEYTDVEDVYDPGRRREVLLAQPNLKLKPDFQAQDNVVAVPVAIVNRRYDSEYQLDETFVPPLLQVGSAAPVKHLVTNLVDLLQTQHRSLQERRLKLGDLSSMTATELADYLLQAELVSALTELRTFEQHPQQSPFELYKVLLRYHDRLALQLMPEAVPSAIRYQHEQLTQTFASLNQALRQVLGADRQRSSDGLVLNSIAP
ncbi:MAG: type VI secretion system baseplate subunit TssK, partial [Pseudohongiellaceae bacterium]